MSIPHEQAEQSSKSHEMPNKPLKLHFYLNEKLLIPVDVSFFANSSNFQNSYIPMTTSWT